jgi:hypothetical protein
MGKNIPLEIAKMSHAKPFGKKDLKNIKQKK